MNSVNYVENKYLRKDMPEIIPGDRVKVYVKIKEGDKSRIQVYEGDVLKIKRGGTRASFTVRKLSFGVGVERLFPLHSPVIDKVEVIRHGKVRRAKLYYLRKLKGKAARITERGYK